jgi:hypothetical protein
MTRQEMADHYGVTLSVIKKWIAEFQVKPIPNGVIPRRKKPKEPPTLANGFTIIDVAAHTLGDRLSEDWRGYLLDGKPCNLEDILRAAELPCD